MKILISAFEPFGGKETNASWEALKRIEAPEGKELKKLLVPTVFGLSGEILLKTMREEAPDCVLCLGEAAGRVSLTPERVAINIRDASMEDNAGKKPHDEPVVPGGPAAFFSTLPIKAMTEAARRVGVAATVSNSAGTFVCNDLMYSLLYSLSQADSAIGGFVHVPLCAAQAGAADMPFMPLEDIVRGLEAMLGVL